MRRSATSLGCGHFREAIISGVMSVPGLATTAVVLGVRFLDAVAATVASGMRSVPGLATAVFVLVLEVRSVGAVVSAVVSDSVSGVWSVGAVAETGGVVGARIGLSEGWVVVTVGMVAGMFAEVDVMPAVGAAAGSDPASQALIKATARKPAAKNRRSFFIALSLPLP